MKRMSISLLILAVILSITATSCCLFGSGSSTTEVSHNITATSYKMAIINWELNDTANPLNDVTVVNATAANPTIVDLTPGAVPVAPETTLGTLLNAAALVDGATYDECVFTPLYIEMEFDVAFHVPSVADENGYNVEFVTDGDEVSRKVRFHFNPYQNVWRRDITLYISGILDDSTPTPQADPAYPDGWYWMRRSLENPRYDFLIFAYENDDMTTTTLTAGAHEDDPSQSVMSAGPLATIDQFCNETFWGTDDYDDATVETVIDTSNDTGGLNADWDDFTYTTGDVITCTTDITNSLNFWYETDPLKIYTTLASDADVVDFGPGYNNGGTDESYGDWGFHPFLPIFTNTSAAPAP